jgi:hypothetical protein
MMATQGVPNVMNFDTETGIFTGVWTIEASIGAPTVIYLNTELWYPNGYTHSLSVDSIDESELRQGSFTIDQTDAQHFKIQFTEIWYQGQSATLTITPTASDEAIFMN